MRIFRLVISMMIVIVILGFLISCKPQPTVNTYSTDWRFIRVSDTINYGNYAEVVLYDKETKVMYIFYRSGSGGGLCPIYNADGSLMLYEGE